MPTINYLLDTTGISPSNLIVNEQHTLTEVNALTYRILIPEFAPFYLDNFQVHHTDSLGQTNLLLENVDYTLTLPYLGGSRSVGKMLYGGVTVNSLLVNGTVTITYQTLGGEWTANANLVLEAIAETVYNPKLAVWDTVTNIPSIFPPTIHDQSLDYVYGHQDLITSINGLANDIANRPNGTVGVINHIVDLANPHEVNANQVGLGLIVNLPLATDQEVADRDPVDKYVTYRQLVESGLLSITPGQITNHTDDIANPHQVTKEQLGLGQVVNLPLATDIEVTTLAGLDSYVTLRQIILLVNQMTASNVSVAELNYYTSSFGRTLRN